MKLEERFPLNRLVALSFGGAALLPLIVVWILIFSYFGHTPPSTAGKVALFTCTLALPFALAFWATVTGKNAIRRGLMDDRWPASEQAVQYQLLRSPALARTTWLLLLAGIALPVTALFLIAPHAHHHPWGGLVYFVMAPAVARTELLKLLAPPGKRSETIWLRDIKPLQSAQWGQSQQLATIPLNQTH